MTKVAISHESTDPELMPYRAVSGRNQAMGRTAGEALDALASQLPREDAETLVIVRRGWLGSVSDPGPPAIAPGSDTDPSHQAVFLER